MLKTKGHTVKIYSKRALTSGFLLFRVRNICATSVVNIMSRSIMANRQKVDNTLRMKIVKLRKENFTVREIADS